MAELPIIFDTESTIGLEGREWRWHIGMVAESTRVYDVGKCFAGYEIPMLLLVSPGSWMANKKGPPPAACPLRKMEVNNG